MPKLKPVALPQSDYLLARTPLCLSCRSGAMCKERRRSIVLTQPRSGTVKLRNCVDPIPLG
jgi:hypothetical protein